MAQSSDPPFLLIDALREFLSQDVAISHRGFTPGELRNALGARAKDFPLAEVRVAVHALWKEGAIVVEPPRQGQREVRIWPSQEKSNSYSPSVAIAKQRRQPPPGRATREAADQGEKHFRATLTGLLVSEWRSADNASTQEVLRRLLMNLGARRLGEPGEKAVFQGRRHHCEVPILPGAAVTITEPGWILRNSQGDYLLEKAQVRAA